MPNPLANNPNWTDTPTKTGWYWMSFRRKWRRMNTTDVVWYSECNPGEVRIMNWHPISNFPGVRFHGPIHPPE